MKNEAPMALIPIPLKSRLTNILGGNIDTQFTLVPAARSSATPVALVDTQFTLVADPASPRDQVKRRELVEDSEYFIGR